MQITNQEYNFLMQLSHDTKADCWFNLTQDEKGRNHRQIERRRNQRYTGYS